MKRFILFLALIALAISLKAQTAKLSLKYNGFFDANDSTKNYIVVDLAKTSKADLYKKTLTYINGIYKNPSLVVSAVDGESITINANADHVSTAKGLYKYPFTYTVSIQFKDGKLRFAPRINQIDQVFTVNNSKKHYYIADTDSPNQTEINSVYFKSKKDGLYHVLDRPLKESLDNWVNAYLAGVEKAIQDTW